MAKIIYDDWREEEFNQEDFISKADLDEKYISREELEDNYVTREKYEAKKKQAKQAFANQDKAKQEALAEEADAMAQRIREEITFTAKHNFDTIPDEVKAAREKHPTLSWEEAYQISWYKDTSSANPNPWREKIWESRKEITFDELSDLAIKNPSAYNEIAAKVESWEVKMI